MLFAECPGDTFTKEIEENDTAKDLDDYSDKNETKQDRDAYQDERKQDGKDDQASIDNYTQNADAENGPERLSDLS